MLYYIEDLFSLQHLTSDSDLCLWCGVLFNDKWIRCSNPDCGERFCRRCIDRFVSAENPFTLKIAGKSESDNLIRGIESKIAERTWKCFLCIPSQLKFHKLLAFSLLTTVHDDDDEESGAAGFADPFEEIATLWRETGAKWRESGVVPDAEFAHTLYHRAKDKTEQIALEYFTAHESELLSDTFECGFCEGRHKKKRSIAAHGFHDHNDDYLQYRAKKRRKIEEHFPTANEEVLTLEPDVEDAADRGHELAADLEAAEVSEVSIPEVPVVDSSNLAAHDDKDEGETGAFGEGNDVVRPNEQMKNFCSDEFGVNLEDDDVSISSSSTVDNFSGLKDELKSDLMDQDHLDQEYGGLESSVDDEEEDHELDDERNGEEPDDDVIDIFDFIPQERLIKSSPNSRHQRKEMQRGLSLSPKKDKENDNDEEEHETGDPRNREEQDEDVIDYKPRERPTTSSPNSRLQRKEIRRRLTDDQVSLNTKAAMKEDKDKKLRLLKKTSSEAMQRRDGRVVLEEVGGRIVVEISHELAPKLKPHQIDGIRFLYNAVFEKKEDVINGVSHGGAILAHTMGLGKTLQTIALLEAAHRCIGVKKTLVLCPVNVVVNWGDEFKKWCPKFTLDSVATITAQTDKSDEARAGKCRQWHQNGGVLIVGYDLFKGLVFHDKNKRLMNTFRESLVDPGPDIVICDEGHYIKNLETKLAQAVYKISTKRRIILTGTPLQNDLKEYYAMVDFVKPKLLGTKQEFNNRFINPIKNGQNADSLPADVKLMKKCAYALYNLLSGCIHRRGLSALLRFLKPKHEYVVFVSLTRVQQNLYRAYLDTLNGGKRSLMEDKEKLMNVWNHPVLLDMAKSKTSNWWSRHIPTHVQIHETRIGSKMMVLLAILHECKLSGEKVLIFSQSINTLNYIQALFDKKHNKANVFPQRFYSDNPEFGRYTHGIDYFRIDGKIDAQKRHECATAFNKASCRAKFFLLSSRAASVGINLQAASRVVIFDAAWNPSLDRQAIFRSYRLGQEKPVFVYRLVARGTMEETIYDRQVIKQSLALRVIDEAQIKRHFTKRQLDELYEYHPDDPDDKTPLETPPPR